MIPVYLEVAEKRTFAGCIEWPGWTRSGKDAEAALDGLARYRDRYAAVLRGARIRPPGSGPFDVVESLEGDGTTEFGAPGAHPSVDSEPLTAAEAKRQVRIWRACWDFLDGVGREAPPVLAKGPRGGGRDRDAILVHVVGADQAYARAVGFKSSAFLNKAFDGGPEPVHDSKVREAIAELHEGMAQAVMAGIGEKGAGYRWPPRYLVRRSAWHALDHAWEMEDKS